MQVTYSCPHCQKPSQADVAVAGESLRCDACDWSRVVGTGDIADGQPQRCLACGCADLWRQKDFPQGLGLFLVALGAVLSTIAWANYMPRTALGVLLAFALADLLLYAFMKDVLVCYRCRARYRHTVLDADYPRFNLETAERYRQEAARLAGQSPPVSSRS